MAIHTKSGASLPAKIWNILKAQWKRSCFTFRCAGNGLAPTTNKYCDFSATLTCSVKNYNLQCPKLKIHKKCIRVSFFNISPIISHNFHGIHHYIVDLWTSCVYSIFRYWHHAKFATGYRITTMWAPKQNGRKVWLKEQHLAIWHANEDRLHWHKLSLLKM